MCIRDSPREPSAVKIQEVTLGASAADSGTRRRPVTLGGQDAMPFHRFEGEIPRLPVLALEVFDQVNDRVSPVLRECWGPLLEDPPAMARKAVEEYGAEMISV